MSKKYNICFFVGTSGSGKTYNLQKLIKENKNVVQKLSNTTRKIREGEINAVDYLFQDADIYNENTFKKDEHEKIIKTPDDKKIVEIIKTSEGYYWTTEDQITDLADDKVLAAILTPEGIKTFVDYFQKYKDTMDFDFFILFYDIPQNIQIARIMIRDKTLPIEKIINRIKSNDRIRNETKEIIESDKYREIFKDKVLIQNIIFDENGEVVPITDITPSNFNDEENERIILEIKEKIKDNDFLKTVEEFNKKIDFTYSNTNRFINENCFKKVKKTTNRGNGK